MIKDYYSRVSSFPVEHLEKRELGFGEFDKKIAYRHKSFRNFVELRRYLVDVGPPFISYSAAEYERPEARPIEKKGVIGGELVFDLDATDLEMPCAKEHGTNIVCQICLDAVKRETIRLIEEFLVPDFGLSKNDIAVNFSGNRGYHVHISNEKVFGLDSVARKQITEYISPPELDPTKFFPTLGMKGVEIKGSGTYDKNQLYKKAESPNTEAKLIGPKPNDAGWGGKIAKSLISALNSGEEAVEALGIPKPMARRLLKNRGSVILGITTGNWDSVKIDNKADVCRNIVKGLAIKQGNSIDRNVTNDIRHLIRMPDTIHGETGLLAKTMKLDELDAFEPMRDAIIFKNSEVLVKVSKAPKIGMNGRQFGPYENKTLGLPIYLGIYLMLKGLATLG